MNACMKRSLSEIIGIVHYEKKRNRDTTHFLC